MAPINITSTVSAIAVAVATSQYLPAVAAPAHSAPAVEQSVAAVNDNAPEPAMAEIAEVGFVSRNATFEREALRRAFDVVSHAVEKRNTIPILSNVAMRQVGDTVVVTGTDLDLEISVTVPASVDAGFATTLPADLVKKLLKSAKASDLVAFDTGEDRDTLDFQRATYQLNHLPIKDFPTFYKPGEKANAFTMSGPAFLAALESVSVAMSTEETRYYLHGAFIHAKQHGNRHVLAFAATDGHRLHMQEIELPAGAEDLAGFILPRKTVDVLCKIMRGKACPESVAIKMDAGRMTVSFDGVMVATKAIDGTFPDYERVIPRENDLVATINAAAMLDAIQAVTLLSAEKSRAVKLTFDAGTCKLDVNDPDAGSATTTFDCDYDGDAIEIGFNSKYLVSSIEDAIGNGSDIVMKLRDSGSPAVVTGGREDFLSVLMPMRV